MNNVSLSGFVGKQPTIRKSEGGNETIATFSIAVKQFFTRNGQKEEKTNWIPIVAFSRNAELVEKYVESGKLIGITGCLNQNSFEDAATGEKKSSIEVILEKIDFFSLPKTNEEQ